MWFLPYEIEMVPAHGEFIVSLSAPGLSEEKKYLAVPDTFFYIKSLNMYFLINSSVFLRCILHYS